MAAVECDYQWPGITHVVGARLQALAQVRLQPRATRPPHVSHLPRPLPTALSCTPRLRLCHKSVMSKWD